MTLYRSKFDGVSVFGSLEDVFPREDVRTQDAMLHLEEQWCNAEWRYLKVLLPSGFVGWVLLNNLEEVE